MHTCVYVNTYDHTCNIHAYMVSICTYMNVYCTNIPFPQIFLPKRRGRDSLPAEGNTPVQPASKKMFKRVQNAFDVFRSRTPIYFVNGGELCHCSSMAVKMFPVLLYLYPFWQYTCIHAYTRICIHIHTYTCVYIHIRTYTCIYAQIYTWTCSIKSRSGGVLERRLPTFYGCWV